MAAYFLFDIEVLDETAFADYAIEARRLLVECGGAIVINSQSIDSLEGGWTPASIVVAKFANMQAARAFYDSAEYQQLLRRRGLAAHSKGVLLESAD